MTTTHTTTPVPVDITCPSWCEMSPAEHAANLWNYEGRLIHMTADTEIPDTQGWSTYGESSRYHQVASVFLSTVTDPNGWETESPVMFIDDREHSIQQAMAMADEIRRQVELYRSTGGKA